MKNANIVLNRKEELTAIAMLMMRRMEINLAPIDRIVFLRLLICYGGRKISIENLSILAEEIKVNWVRLKKSLGILIERGLCEQIGKSIIRLNKALLPRQIGYQRKGKSLDQKIDTLVKVEEGDDQVQESNEEKTVRLIADKTEIKSTASKLVARYKRYDFLVHLFSLIFKVQISHKQKNVDQLLALNFKQWLILVNMVLSSDQNGIVFNVGTYELSKWTGMSRNALHHAITELFNMGIIRSKLDGTLNSNLLQSVAPVYSLNLSASIWGDKRIYGNFYLVKFPQEYLSIAQQAFNFIRGLNLKDQFSSESISSDVVLSELESGSKKDYYRIIKSTLSDEIQEEFNFATKFERSFCKYIQLMTPSFRLGQSSLNTESANINRINFMLGYFIHSKICNSSDIEGWLNSPMPVSSMAWFSRYLTKIVLPEQYSILFQDEKKIMLHFKQVK